MTTEVPCDAEGYPLHRAAGPKPHSHLSHRLHRYVQRIAKSLETFALGLLDALGERDAKIARLEQQVEELRRTVDVHRAIAHLTARIDRLEEESGTVIADVRPTNGSAHHHDG